MKNKLLVGLYVEIKKAIQKQIINCEKKIENHYVAIDKIKEEELELKKLL